MNKWLLPILLLMAGSVYGDGSGPASPHKWAKKNTMDTIYIPGTSDTIIIIAHHSGDNATIIHPASSMSLKFIGDTIVINGVPIMDFEGTNLSVTAGVLNASGGGSGTTDTVGFVFDGAVTKYQYLKAIKILFGYGIDDDGVFDSSGADTVSIYVDTTNSVLTIDRFNDSLLWRYRADTAFLVDKSGNDTLLAVWDDDAGNVRIQTAVEDQTLHILVDTMTIGGDVIKELAGNNLVVASGNLDMEPVDTTTAEINKTQWTESITDHAGGMVTGNTETGIAVTFQDGDNTIDFVLSSDFADSTTWNEIADNWDVALAGTDDTIRWIIPGGDTAFVVMSDEAGNTVITVGKESDNSATTLRIDVDTLQMGSGNFIYYDTDAFKFNDRVVIEDNFNLTIEGGRIHDSAAITAGGGNIITMERTLDNTHQAFLGIDGSNKINEFFIGMAVGDSEIVTIGVDGSEQAYVLNDGNVRKGGAAGKAEADSNLVTANTVNDTGDVLRAEMGDTADVLRAQAVWDSVAAPLVDSFYIVGKSNDTGMILTIDGVEDSLIVDFGQKNDPYVVIRNVDLIELNGVKITGVSSGSGTLLGGNSLAITSKTISGDLVVNSGGVMTIQDNAVAESDVDITNTGTTGQVLTKAAGDQFTWANDAGGIWVYEAADQSIIAWVNDSTGDTTIYFMDSSLTIIDAGENIGFRFQDSVHAIKFTIPDAFDWTSGDSSVADKGYVDSALQSPTNLSIFGQMNIFGNLAVTNFENRLDMSAPILFRTTDWLGKDGINPLPTTIGDSTNNDQDSSLATHPSCLYYPMGWGADGNRKYRYLMAYTPLDAVTDENPHFAVSEDGIIWQDSIWTGSDYDTIPTPIFDADDVGAIHLSDPDLFFDKNGRLWIVVRAVHSAASPNEFNQQLWLSGSDDGLTWDTPLLLIDSADGSGTLVQDSGLLSPAVILDSSGVLKMFIVREEDTPSATADTNEIAIYINPSGVADSIGGDGWQLDTILTEVNNDIVNVDSGQEIWHIEVIPRGADELLMLVTTAHSLDNTSGIGGLALATSSDGGYSWTKAECPAANCVDYYNSDVHAWDAPDGYHVSGWWKNKGNQTVLQAYGGTKREETSRWAIFRSEIHFQSSQDTTQIPARYEFNQVYGVDSAWTEDTLTLEITNGNKIWKFKAISGGTDVDSLDVAMSCYVADSFSCDSFVFVYESDINNAASQFDSLTILVQGKTGPDLYPDSIALTYNTQQIAQVPTRVAIAFPYTFAPHELATVKFRISITNATRWVALHHAYLKGSSPNKPFSRTPYDLRFLPAP